MIGEVLPELIGLLRLRLLPGVGDRTVTRLLAHFGTAVAALEADHAPFAALAGKEAARAREDEGEGEARAILERAGGLGMAVAGIGLPGYPPALLRLVDPPPVLFLRGRLELLDAPALAVVGARRATGEGRRFARWLGEELAGAGVAVVSGLALGIDAAAHRGALGGAGSTVAVLASGLDEVHPASHRRLQERIGHEGLLVSEFFPGERVWPHHFPRRNRILAGLGRGLAVIEAGERSGALITVDHALDLGIRIFAVPGPLSSPSSIGTNALLRDGAECLVDPRDLLGGRESGMEDPLFPEFSPRVAARDPRPEGGERGELLSLLGTNPVTVEALQERSGLRAHALLPLLLELELEGRVLRSAAGWCITRRPDEARGGGARRIPSSAGEHGGAGGILQRRGERGESGSIAPRG